MRIAEALLPTTPEYPHADAPGEPPSVAVLVVNDRKEQRVAIRAMLQPLYLAVVEAESGRSALRAVMRQTFAAIVMDVRMPTMDGFETAKLIRRRAESQRTPIIFATAFGGDDNDQSEAAYAEGAIDFIFAPIRPEVLRAKISAFVDLFMQSERLQSSLDSITSLHGELIDSEERHRAILQYVANGIVTVSEGGLIESFNRSAQQIFGYSEEEVIGRPLELLIATGHLEAFAGAVLACRSLAVQATDPLPPAVTAGRRKDGSSFAMEMDMSRIEVGERTFLTCCPRDVSGREELAARAHRRAQALRREAERYRVAFDEAPIGSMITGADGRIQRVNQAICRMTGHTPEQLVGTQALELIHPEDREQSAAAAAEMLAGESGTRRCEKRYLHRSGRVLEVRLAVTAIHDDEHEIAQLYSQIEDVTDARATTRGLEESQFEMLARLAAAAELRDDATGRHTRRVGELSVSIAEDLGLPGDQVSLLRLAAPLHDIGKIAIPDAVLSKPGKLTADEFEQVKTHTTVGAKMLTGSAHDLLAMAEQIALTHHEHWDGSGYPHGLAGEAIPIAGRIVAVADVFDALTHERPYKTAWSPDDAITEMRTQSGRHFDPQVLEAFLSRRAGDPPSGGSGRSVSGALAC